MERVERETIGSGGGAVEEETLGDEVGVDAGSD
jgi:hypothetical protein